MTEFYVVIVMLGYLLGYLIIGCGSTAFFKKWAMNHFGDFWEYSLNKGMQMYYPDYWWFARHRNLLYSVLYISAWPIMVPRQLTMSVRSLKKILRRDQYWY